MSKKYFTIKAEYLAPIEVSYKIYAEDEDEALKIFETNPPNKNLISQPQIKWGRLKRLMAKVFSYGTIMVLKSKKY